MNIWQIERYASRLAPNVFPLNAALIARQFRRRFGRNPRKLSDPQADYHDFLVDRMARNGWTDQQTRCVDKELAKKEAVKLAPGISVSQTIDVIRMSRDLSFTQFTKRIEPYIGRRLVAKPTQGSAATVFLDRDPDVLMLYRAGRYNYFYSLRETQYAPLEHKIIVEENITGLSDLNDFKFFCANGEILFVQVDSDRFTGHNRILLDPDLQPLPFQLGSFPRSVDWKEPSEQVCKAASLLCQPFDFVRVDLYEVNEKVYFGEFTFTPGAGMEPFSDEAFSKSILKKIRR